MVSTEFAADEMVFEEIVEDLLPPCEYADEVTCAKGPAEWVLYCVPCACGNGGVRLACTDCKDKRLSSDNDGCVACECCGAVTSPARLAYSHCEPLERRR